MRARFGNDRLTTKERNLVRGLAKSVKDGSDKSLRNIALEAGFGKGVNANSAAAQASTVLRHPNVKAALDAALDRAGVSLDKSAGVIAAAHRAETIKIFKTEDDKLIYSEPLVDHVTRLRAAEFNLKARGLMRSDEAPASATIGLGLFILKGLQERGLGHRLDEESPCE